MEMVKWNKWYNSLDAHSRTTERIGDKAMIEDIRGYCNRNCIYNDNGRCDMWDAFAMPEDVDKCYRQLLI